MPHEELNSGIPVLRKEMVVARAIGQYENGEDDKGVLDESRLQKIVRNFVDHPRQVPIFALGDHETIFADLDSRPPAGWVEGVRIVGGEMVADVKLIGEGVDFVEKDLIRGASIGTIHGVEHDGTPFGEALHHVLLTNDPFIKNLNIAAAGSGEKIVSFFTAFKKEGNMPDDPKEEEKKEGMQDDDLTAIISCPNCGEAVAEIIRKKEDEIIQLKAADLRNKESIENLEARLANAKVDQDKEALKIENINLKRDVFGMKIRDLCNAGLQAGTLKASWCDGFAGKGSVDYEGTIRWLKASRFYDATAQDPEGRAFALLKFQAEQSEPIYKVGGQFQSGKPLDADRVQMSSEERAMIQRSGLDPDRIAAMNDATTYEDWKALKAAKGGTR